MSYQRYDAMILKKAGFFSYDFFHASYKTDSWFKPNLFCGYCKKPLKVLDWGCFENRKVEHTSTPPPGVKMVKKCYSWNRIRISGQAICKGCGAKYREYITVRTGFDVGVYDDWSNWQTVTDAEFEQETYEEARVWLDRS